MFTLTAWRKYDLAPATQLLSAAEAEHRAIGYLGAYDSQFNFAGRLTRPVVELHGNAAVASFAQDHADGLIVTHPGKLSEDDLRYALLVQPFRSSWVVVWPARSLAMLRAGIRPPEPATPPRIYPAPQRP